MRTRRTAELIRLSKQRLQACWHCSEDAFWDLDEVLRPLRLRRSERNRLRKALTCPRCDTRLESYATVIGYERDELQDIRRLERYSAKLKPDFDRFHSFLLTFPALGGFHPFGTVLAKTVRTARAHILKPRQWYRARSDEGLARGLEDFKPPAPQVTGAGRFNHAGQVAYYLSEAPGLAAIEKTGDRDEAKRVWIARVDLNHSIRVLDLRMHQVGRGARLPLLLNGLIYTGVDSRELSPRGFS
jgi:hypothetical protein